MSHQLLLFSHGCSCFVQPCAVGVTKRMKSNPVESKFHAGRNQSDPIDGLLVGKRYLIHDHDPMFTAEFLEMLADIGIQSVKLPPRSPNLNTYAERFVRTLKESCLDRLILIGEGSLRKAMREFVAHYHLERNYQGLGNRLITPQAIPTDSNGTIQRRQRLGGMLN
jgi:Integrase core domain